MIEKLKNETPKPLYYMLIIFASISISVITSLINQDFSNMLTNYIKNPLINLLGINFNNELLVFGLFLFLAASLVFTLSFLVYYLKNKHISFTIVLVAIGLIGQFGLGSISSQNLDLIKNHDSESNTIIETINNNELGIQVNSYGCKKAFPYISCGFEIINNNDYDISLSTQNGNKLYNSNGEEIKHFSAHLGSFFTNTQMYNSAKLLPNKSITGHMVFNDQSNQYNDLEMMEFNILLVANKKRNYSQIKFKNLK